MASPIGVAGDPSLNPRFHRRSSSRLTRQSAVVDEGSPDLERLPEWDLLGTPRNRDGSENRSAAINVAVFEVPAPLRRARLG